MKSAITAAVVLLITAAGASAQGVSQTAARRAGETATAPAEPGTLNLEPRGSEPGTPNPEPGTDTDLSSRIQSLYSSAAYEEVLASLPAPGVSVSRDLEQYRALCLLALGRQAEAAASVARVVTQDPLFVPPASDTPPRLQTMYADARVKMAPALAKAAYAEAKEAWGRKDGPVAHSAFQRTLDIIAVLPDPAAAGLADLRELASGFVQLTAALAKPAAPAPGAVPAPGGAPAPPAAAPAAASAAAVPVETWQGPTSIRQDMPGWQPPDPSARRLEYRGRIRVAIDSTGKVAKVDVIKPSHPAYDAAVIRASRAWSFNPAMRGGRPVDSEKEIEVYLRPQ